jgi:hypothetical protein
MGGFVIRSLPRTKMIWFVLILSAVIYGTSMQHLGKRKRIGSEPEFSVRLPIPAQVLLSAGDRQLAANLAGFRVLVADTFRMRAEDFAIQATLQKDISWLNPAHEDNYYIAAALLPWSGQLEAAQIVLKRAADMRTFDWQPLFYYGFDLYHFYKDPIKGAEALLMGVSRTNDPQDQWALQNLAAIWVEKGYSLAEAAGRVEAMASNAPPGGFKRYLSIRAARLRDLERLRTLAQDYERQRGVKLTDIDALVRTGLADKLPVDPLGVGFAVDTQGMPVFRDSLPREKR